MDSKYKRKALTGLGVALAVCLCGAGWILFTRGTPLAAIGFIALVAALPFYLWGCAALAQAKGYSTAIVLTVILGGLFPLVVLLALPDKNRRRQW
jgi:hypothetical protein